MPPVPPTREALVRHFENVEARAAEARARLFDLLESAWQWRCYQERWAAAGVTAPDLVTEEVFSRLPTIDKEQVSELCARKPATDAPAREATKPNSSIAQVFRTDVGELCHFTLDRRARMAIGVLGARGWLLAGIQPGDIVQICQTYDINSPAWVATWGLDNLGALVVSASGLRATPALRQIEFIRTFAVQAMYADLDVLAALATAAREEGYAARDLSVERILLPASDLRPGQRAQVEQVWGAAVYGVHESKSVPVWSAVECEDSRAADGALGMHIWDDAVLMEVVDGDGKRCPNGVPGELVETSGLNPARPLVRYRTGIRARLLAPDCRCGLRTHRLLLEPNGV
jgi:phenylacetate-CoA ligase